MQDKCGAFKVSVFYFLFIYYGAEDCIFVHFMKLFKSTTTLYCRLAPYVES